MKRGQATVEYILLFAVMAAIMMAIYRSKEFQDLFGKNSSFFDALANYVEYTYRHGDEGVNDTSTTAPGGYHRLYKDQQTGSRFFGPFKPYPE